MTGSLRDMCTRALENGKRYGFMPANGRASWKTGNSHDQEGEKAKDVQNNCQTLEDRHLANGGRVEEYGTQDVSHSKQRAVPALGHVV